MHLSHLTGFSAARDLPLMMVRSDTSERTCYHAKNSLVIVEALLRGVQEGQDILTMSLGGADGWTESTSSVLSSRIAATGKIVTIAAGQPR